MSKSNYFSFLGRPDGLGNRLEEIIKIEIFCLIYNLKCEYLWINKFKNRSYDVLFDTKNVSIVSGDNLKPNYPVKNILELEVTYSQNEALNSAKNIRPKFEIKFKENISPVGVHIRASDRVGRNHPHFMKDEKELQSYLSEVIHLLNNKKPKDVYVCSESVRCKEVFVSYLDKEINIVEPIFDNEIPSEYIDFFALTHCSEIWMVSRFSTFSIVAALVGNVPIFSFVNDTDVRERYKAEFHYHSLTGKSIVTDKLIQLSFIQKMRVLINKII
jgi:hypothetical protein